MTCFENFINDHYDELLQHSYRYVGKKYGADVLHDMLYAFLTKQHKLDALCERGEMMSYICRAIYIATNHSTTVSTKSMTNCEMSTQTITADRKKQKHLADTTNS